MSGSDNPRSQPSNPVATRRQLLLGLPALCLAAPAFADRESKQEIKRIELPDDPALAVSIRVKGKFTSLYNKQTRVLDLPTTLCVYAADDEITAERMPLFQAAGMPSIPEAGWGAFAPAEKMLTYTFDITDTLGRMSRILLRDMETNALLATFKANAAGTILHGQVKLSADTRKNYVVWGVNKKNEMLFRLATNYGKADAFSLYVCHGSFEPNRSLSAPCGGQSDNGKGPTGDPLSYKGVRSLEENDASKMLAITPAYSNVSRLDVYKAEENDSDEARGMAPPDAIKSLTKRQILRDTVRPDIEKYLSFSFDKTDIPKLLAEARKTDTSPLFSEITMPPHSKNCGRWQATLTGTAYAFYAIPASRISSYSDATSKVVQTHTAAPQPGVKPLIDLAIGTEQAILKDPEYGEEGKWLANEIIPLGDIYILEAQARG